MKNAKELLNVLSLKGLVQFLDGNFNIPSFRSDMVDARKFRAIVAKAQRSIAAAATLLCLLIFLAIYDYPHVADFFKSTQIKVIIVLCVLVIPVVLIASMHYIIWWILYKRTSVRDSLEVYRFININTKNAIEIACFYQEVAERLYKKINPKVSLGDPVYVNTIKDMEIVFNLFTSEIMYAAGDTVKLSYKGSFDTRRLRIAKNTDDIKHIFELIIEYCVISLCYEDNKGFGRIKALFNFHASQFIRNILTQETFLDGRHAMAEQIFKFLYNNKEEVLELIKQKKMQSVYDKYPAMIQIFDLMMKVVEETSKIGPFIQTKTEVVDEVSTSAA